MPVVHHHHNCCASSSNVPPPSYTHTRCGRRNYSHIVIHDVLRRPLLLDCRLSRSFCQKAVQQRLIGRVRLLLLLLLDDHRATSVVVVGRLIRRRFHLCRRSTHKQKNRISKFPNKSFNSKAKSFEMMMHLGLLLGWTAKFLAHSLLATLITCFEFLLSIYKLRTAFHTLFQFGSASPSPGLSLSLYLQTIHSCCWCFTILSHIDKLSTRTLSTL